jgi:hypothetical protein
VLLPVMLLSGALGGLGGLPVLAGHDLAVLGVWAVAACWPRCACSAGSRSRPGTPLGQALTVH